MNKKYLFFLTLISLTTLIIGCDKPDVNISELSAACINSGGIDINASCCQSASDYPNNCAIGACGCSPDNSKLVHYCDCGPNKCWSGSTCTTTEI